MTPKEKAFELKEKYLPVIQSVDGGCDDIEYYLPDVKQCAHIAVDEILAELEFAYNGEPTTTNENYWKQVKQEIEKL